MSDRDGGEDVFVMRRDGSAVRNVTRTPALEESHPQWAPDGRLTFTRHGETGPIELVIADRDGTGARKVATGAEPVFVYSVVAR
jgi:Tol biopolymer transport system component